MSLDETAGMRDGRALSDDEACNLARRLHTAELSRAPIPQPSRSFAGMTIEDAYAVQRFGVEFRLAEGRKLVGRKIGLTSLTMRRAVGIDEPDYGALFDDMVFDEGSTLPTGRFIEPRVETELAFVLGSPLEGPNRTLFDVLRATEFVRPALEILDARVQMTDSETGRGRTIVDTIADNAADAGLVLGGRVVAPMDVDLRWIAALLSRNGQVEESGVSAAVLNHPGNGVAWLANRIAPYGDRLEAGQIVLSGSFTRPVHAQPGDTFCADFGLMGSISCRFAPEGS